jgi:hypothetical protein
MCASPMCSGGGQQKKCPAGNKPTRSRLVLARNGQQARAAPARPSTERRQRTDHISQPPPNIRQRVLTRPESRGLWRVRAVRLLWGRHPRRGLPRGRDFFCATRESFGRLEPLPYERRHTARCAAQEAQRAKGAPYPQTSRNLLSSRTHGHRPWSVRLLFCRGPRPSRHARRVEACLARRRPPGDGRTTTPKKKIEGRNGLDPPCVIRANAHTKGARNSPTTSRNILLIRTHGPRVPDLRGPCVRAFVGRGAGRKKCLGRE